MNQTSRNNRNIPFLFLAALALLAGIWAGLIRLGVQLPAFAPLTPSLHGLLMVVGFLATLISLERVVALNQIGPGPQENPTSRGLLGINPKLFYLVPAASSLGIVLLLFDLPLFVSGITISVSAFGFVLLISLIAVKYFDLATSTLLIAAILYLIGSLIWLVESSVSSVVPWWIAFLILTIAGERLELTRIIRRERWISILFAISLVVVVGGLLISLAAVSNGVRLVGLGFLLLAIWLFAFDIARRTIRRPKVTGYIAACLLLGFLWLGVGGLLWIYFGGGYSAGSVYDAMIHVLLIGCVFSMIFGHAPVILPGVTGRPLGYLPIFFLPLALLHLSLVLRLIGDFLQLPTVKIWGGIGNGLAILLFLALSAYSVRLSSRENNLSQQDLTT